jgi:hypothetical protein
MGIIGSLRVSNFSLIWVTDSPFLSFYLLKDGFHHLATFKNITQGKPPGCEYFSADLGIVANGINGLSGDAHLPRRFLMPRFPDCLDVTILGLLSSASPR